MITHDPVYALLDDAGATAAAPRSRLYQGFVRMHRCDDPRQLDATWAAVDADLRQGLHAVLQIDYEWGARLLQAGHRRLADVDAGALRVLMFSRLQRLDATEVEAWLAASCGPGPAAPAGLLDLAASVDEAAFTRDIGRILEAIRAGETYQVNYTYRLQGSAYGPPERLYARLRARQPVAYGALLALPAGEPVTHLLSCSPELFLRNDGGALTARPMKGTAARVAPAEADGETARMLSFDTKNRAENLMIVDLLRNDLGRVAETGSVTVPDLFTIESYATVFQMTSTVRATLRPGTAWPELLRAVFPCGSITGAPKHHTMDLIAGLESTPRGAYCGAIGWVEAPAAGGARIGDFCLSVAIRTLALGAEADGLRPARFGVGAGIVSDSRADEEYAECRLKARFLTGLAPGYELIETMRVGADGAIALLPWHLARLEGSARALGFPWERAQVVAAIDAALLARGDLDGPAAAAHPPVWRLRLALAADGRPHALTAPLAALPAGPVGLLLAPRPLPSRRPLSAHKTTLRADYDAGIRAAEQAGAFDMLFFTPDGRLVEGGRTSVFARLDGRWWTPPLADGALPGVLRAQLLEDAAWQAAERTLRLADLQQADALVVCNALRGALPARLIAPAPALAG